MHKQGKDINKSRWLALSHITTIKKLSPHFHVGSLIARLELSALMRKLEFLSRLEFHENFQLVSIYIACLCKDFRSDSFIGIRL